MSPRPSWKITIALALLLPLSAAWATTTMNLTREDVATMATLWETDCLIVSPFANEQYPTYTSDWEFIFPHTSISSDGDIHTDMAVDSSGSGSTGNNIGESPIVGEVVNGTNTELTHLEGLTRAEAIFTGIFRLYTEHPSERHFEIHPTTSLEVWDGTGFVLDTDYHSNIVAVPDGTTHSTSTLIGLLDGSQTVTATVGSDNDTVTFSFPSPSVNYVQYAGTALSGLEADDVSDYFLFRPDLVPTATVTCRLIADTAAASAAAGLIANQGVTVNALTRTDMAGINTQISTMTAGQMKTFARPVELITLDLPGIGPTPTPTPTPSPTSTPTPTPSGTTFTNASPITVKANPRSRAKGVPYPAIINVSGITGTVSKVTATLNGLTMGSGGYATDVDILLVGPDGSNTMLMSDAGGSAVTNINLTLDDAATSSIPSSSLTSGTYKPTNYNPKGDKDAFPPPAPRKPFGSLLSIFNGRPANGAWKVFLIDEYTSGSGSISGGWSLTIYTQSLPHAQPAAVNDVEDDDD